MLSEPVLPLAAFADVMEVIVPILFMVLYVISQLLGGKENAKKAKRPRPAPPQPPAGGGPPNQVPNQAPNQADALRKEVEQFLRRAQGQAEPPREKLAPPVQTIAQRPAKRPTKQRSNLPKKTPPRKVQPSPVSRELRKEGVAEHVSRHMGSGLTKHAEQLGHLISQADEKTESRLEAKFGRRLAIPQHGSQSADQKKPALAAKDLFKLLSQPESMHQAILLQEILRRPTDRW